MPRSRKPSVEQQGHDQRAVNACIVIIDGIASRYPERDSLSMALRCLTEFGNARIEQPKPRTRNPNSRLMDRLRPKASDEQYRDGKSAAANDDTREMAHA
jgi:hypothetical protein